MYKTAFELINVKDQKRLIEAVETFGEMTGIKMTIISECYGKEHNRTTIIAESPYILHATYTQRM